MKTLYHIWELEGTQLLTLIAISFQKLQLAGYLLTGKPTNFHYVGVSTVWFYDYRHFLSFPCETDIGFDRIAINNQDTVLYIDAITRHIFSYATPVSCDNNPQNIIAMNSDNSKR